MPPHLHPRSLLTTSLFTSTLAISFLVVGLPHLLPCPVQPRSYADEPSDPNRPRRRRRKPRDTQDADAEGVNGTEAEERPRPARECPVPKPGGLVGTIMGFKDSERKVVPIIRIEPMDRRGQGRSDERGQG